MPAALSPSSIIKRQDTIVEATIDGETVMMSIENGEYYGLDTIGTRIWQLIETPMTISDLSVQLSNEYEVSSEQCLADVMDFLTDLKTRQIIEMPV